MRPCWRPLWQQISSSVKPYNQPQLHSPISVDANSWSLPLRLSTYPNANSTCFSQAFVTHRVAIL
jgi:hypothetical protein